MSGICDSGASTNRPAGEVGNPPIAWCLVANVAPQHHVDDLGQVRAGTRYFEIGAKVWICSAQWGDGGEKTIVLGRRRGTRGRKWSRVVMPMNRLTGFRAAPIYSRTVYDRLTRPWRARRHPSSLHRHERPVEFIWTREIAERWAEGLNARDHRWWEDEPWPRPEGPYDAWPSWPWSR